MDPTARRQSDNQPVLRGRTDGRVVADLVESSLRPTASKYGLFECARAAREIHAAAAAEANFSFFVDQAFAQPGKGS